MVKAKIKELFKNFYFLFFVSFILWMVVIDSNGFVNRYRLTKKLSELEAQKEFYVQEIDKVSTDKEKFESDQELLEKYAREQYLMKKESEDIFYIILSFYHFMNSYRLLIFKPLFSIKRCHAS